MPVPRRGTATVKISLLLFVLLVSLAALQYRWTGELRRADRESMRASLRQLVARFAEDFNREAGRLFFHFLAEPRVTSAPLEQRVRERFETWKAEATYPQLIRDLFLVDTSGGAPALRKLNADELQFAAVDWPEELGAVKDRFVGKTPIPHGALLDGNAATLLVPARSPDRRDQGSAPRAWVILRLDMEFIRSTLLPELRERYFSAEGLDYALAVFSRGPASHLVYQSDLALASDFFDSADATAGLFSLRPSPTFAREGPPMAGEPPQPPAGPPGPPRGRGFGAWRPRRPPWGPPTRGGESLWEIRVRHRAGSLEAAVDQARLRNLGVSLGILTLLAASVLMLIVSNRRAHALARQQMDFVAGVSHELRTPLAVIRSAAENLAQGVVQDGRQIAQYGALILKEGRRLSQTVDQVLEFAHSPSSRAYQLAPVSVGEVVDAALAAAEPLIKEQGIRVERRIAGELPPVKADASALSQAVVNLIVNAVKYGGQGRWVGVSADREGSKPAGVAITVSDRGPGIDEADFPHIFEPFYRGREAAVGGRGGSGLGLSLVRRIVETHGGRVTVESRPGRGSAFTVHLPVDAGAS